MKLRVLATAGTAFAIAFGALGASGAGATTIDLHAYLGDTIAIGTSAPGDPNSQVCLVVADSPTTYGGKINGVVAPGHSGQLNISYFSQTFATLPSCTPTPITVTDVPVDNIVTPTSTGGSIQAATISSTQSGILATAVTTMRVNYGNPAMTVKTPSGATLIDGALTGGSYATFTLKPTVSMSKSSLNLAACSDNQYVIDAATQDGSVSNGPKATKITGSQTPAVGAANTYVATIRDCAQNQTPVAGKETKAKFVLLGHGAVSVQFVKSSTENPQTWDTTRGSVCTAVKTAGTFGSALLSSRVIQCKGDWGAAIPLALDVRNWSTASGTDPNGLLHPGAPVTIVSGTI